MKKYNNNCYESVNYVSQMYNDFSDIKYPCKLVSTSTNTDGIKQITKSTQFGKPYLKIINENKQYLNILSENQKIIC